MKQEEKYINLLSKSSLTIATASIKIINLETVMNLLKGIGHF